MTANKKILIVDDEPDFCALMEKYFQAAGFIATSVGNAGAMRAALLNDPPRVVLLDLGLPDAEGIDLARELSNHHDIGVIIVSGRGSSVDRIVGLEIGADDYVAKPFDERELLARVRSVIRRVENRPVLDGGQNSTIALVRFGNWELDLVSHELRGQNGDSVHLTSNEFKLLSFMATNCEKVMSRDELLEHLMGRDWNPYDRSVDTLVCKIRQKIERNSRHPELIKSIRGSGYKFTVDTETVERRH